MTVDEVKKAADYVRELEEALYEWEMRGASCEAELPVLVSVIKGLMDAAYASEDENRRVALARLEYRARWCYKAILRRGGMTN